MPEQNKGTIRSRKDGENQVSVYIQTSYNVHSHGIICAAIDGKTLLIVRVFRSKDGITLLTFRVSRSKVKSNTISIMAMTSIFDYGAIATPQEAEALGRILAQCFNSSTSESSYFERIGLEHVRRLLQDGQLVGGLVHIPMGQWWGQQPVSMTGIAAVGITPEYRGSGAAIALMHNTVQELHQQGVALSVLYPAVQRLYRKAGYEQAGTYCGWELKTTDIQLKGRSLPIRAVALEPELFMPLYEQQARQTNGYLARSIAIWKEILHSAQKKPLFAYLFGESSQPQGYVIFYQEYINDKAVLRIRDWALLTAAAEQTFWAFLADHRSQIDKVYWQGSAIDPLTLGLPEQVTTVRFLERWLMRIINVPQALEQRGYPLGVETELHFKVYDDWLPANQDSFILSVAHQRGTVTRGGRSDLKLNIRALAPLYTGLFTPQSLKLADQLEATDSAVLVATQLFAGASPWMPDFF